MPIPTFPRQDDYEDQFLLKPAGLRDTHSAGKIIDVSIEETLVSKYGAVMNIAQLAAVLGRSPEGMRQSLRTSNAWVQRINATKFQLGRRVYFRTLGIAKVLSEGED